MTNFPDRIAAFRRYAEPLLEDAELRPHHDRALVEALGIIRELTEMSNELIEHTLEPLQDSVSELLEMGYSNEDSLFEDVNHVRHAVLIFKSRITPFQPPKPETDE